MDYSKKRFIVKKQVHCVLTTVLVCGQTSGRPPLAAHAVKISIPGDVRKKHYFAPVSFFVHCL
jgi:hypothetical protein